MTFSVTMHFTVGHDLNGSIVLLNQLNYDSLWNFFTVKNLITSHHLPSKFIIKFTADYESMGGFTYHMAFLGRSPGCRGYKGPLSYILVLVGMKDFF